MRKLTQGNERQRPGEAWCYSTSHGHYSREQEGRTSHRHEPPRTCLPRLPLFFPCLEHKERYPWWAETEWTSRENEKVSNWTRETKRARLWRMWKMKESMWEHSVLFQEKVIEMSGLALSLSYSFLFKHHSKVSCRVSKNNGQLPLKGIERGETKKKRSKKGRLLFHPRKKIKKKIRERGSSWQVLSPTSSSSLPLNRLPFLPLSLSLLSCFVLPCLVPPIESPDRRIHMLSCEPYIIRHLFSTLLTCVQ